VPTQRILILLTLMIFGLLTGARFYIQKPVDLKAPYQSFEIKEGEGILAIAKKLEQNGFIRSKWLFSFYIFAINEYSHLQAGTYSLSPAINIPTIARKIINGESAYIAITIPEGFTNKQIEERISQKIPLKQNGLSLGEQKAESYKDKFNFLEDVPDETNLEGFFFPDTYYFNIEAGRQEIIEKMLDNFGEKVNPELRQVVIEQDKNIFDIVIMASMIEKEVRAMHDKKLVAGILWKRLENNMPLQIDATVVFATDGKITNITNKETQIDSPYNTYKYKGLPVGPICNPGLESIEAAIYPQESVFWYYLSTPEGETIFSRNFQEHLIAKQKYL